MKYIVSQTIDLAANLLCLFLVWACPYLSYTQGISIGGLASMYLMTLIISNRCQSAYSAYKQDKKAFKFYYILIPRAILTCVVIWITVKELFF